MATTPVTAPLSAAPVPTAASSNAADARRTGEEFEAFFLSSILENLFTGIKTDGPFGGGQSEGVWRSMLLQEYGKVTARAGGVGIADAVQREILRLQETR